MDCSNGVNLMKAIDPLGPTCCQRCTHLVTLHSPGASRTACLRALPLSAACGWWRPRRLGFAEAPAPATAIRPGLQA